VARYMRTDLGRGHTRLFPPAVIGAGIAFFGPGTKLVEPLSPNRINRRYVEHRLRPPIVVAAAAVAETARPVSVTLALSRRGRVLSRLGPPAVAEAVAAAPFPPIQGRLSPLTTLRQRLNHYRLAPPAVVTVEEAAPLARPVAIHTAYSRRGHASFRLGTPVVVFVETYYGPAITLTYGRFGRPVYELKPPTVVTQPEAFVARPVLTNLVQRPRPPAQTLLRPPTVIDLTPQVFYLSTTLARIRPVTPHSRLAPPTVIFTPFVERAETRVTLARNKPVPTHSRLSLPVVVFLAVELSGPEVTLARNKPVPTRSRLSPPLVVFLAVELSGPQITLARTVIRPVHPRLLPPAVVATVAEERFYPIRVTLVRPPRPRSFSFLSPPILAVAEEVVEIYGPRVALAYSLRGQPQSRLAPPVVIDLSPQTQFLAVHLTYSRSGQPKSALNPPAVVAIEETFAGPGVTLARTVTRPAFPKLLPPTVVAPVLFFGPAVTLVRRPTPATIHRLSAPVVIDLRPQTRFLSVNLTYSKRGRPKSLLRKPPVIGVAPQAVYLLINRTYSVRKRGVAVLGPPTVIDLRPQTRFLAVQLTYSRRGRAKSALRAPTVVERPVFLGVQVRLAYSRRGQPKSVLQPPTVIDLRPQTRFLAVNLTYSRRGRPQSFLQPPTVVVIPAFAGPVTTLTYSRRGRPKSALKPPTVVFLAVEIYGPETALVRIRPPFFFSFLQPPAVVGIYVYYPVQVNLTYSLRGKPRSFYIRRPIENPFVPNQGEVCGTDEAGTSIEGTTAPDSMICGDDSGLGTVCGNDSEFT
jgi:hypothetical protein